MSLWRRRGAHLKSWDSHLLTVECRAYEKSSEQADKMIRRHCQPEPLTDNETEIDPEEQEDEMNNLPSPIQKGSRFWTPEYQARRQARKRLWSPPFTPPWPGGREYSLQPSQRPPPSKRRCQRPAPSRDHPLPSSPPSSSYIQLQLPSKRPNNKVHKSQSKSKPKGIAQPHRPTTRAIKSSNLLSLHLRKGHVEVTSLATGQTHSVAFEQYLEDSMPRFVIFLHYPPCFWVPLAKDILKLPGVQENIC